MHITQSLSGIMLGGAAVAAGALVPLQAGSNAALGRALGHPLWATLVSLCVSLVAVAPVLFATHAHAPFVRDALSMPPWIWFGGIAGVIYITAALMLTPRLGATSFIVCVIAGQMLTSLLIDHFGVMGLPVRHATLGRIAGVLLITGGMLIVQWSTTAANVRARQASAAERGEAAETAAAQVPQPARRS
ncbi:DMT family transporter [Paraburkholderia sp. JHI2823]|uniref:DMT family transporter n=1 Tax=Paraburkholderia sp. JHI2823 TaxID=3112960 RepID=UPI003177AA4C